MWLAPSLVGFKALPCVEAAGHWLARPGHKAPGCRAPGGPRSSTGPPLGGARMCNGWLLDKALRSWVGPIPDMVGCSFQGVPNLVLVHR